MHVHLATLPLVSPPKWRLRNELSNSILITRHYPDLGSTSDWSCRMGNLIQPIRSTTQILVVTRHQYGISALVSHSSFSWKTSGSVARCRLFFHALIVSPWPSWPAVGEPKCSNGEIFVRLRGWLYNRKSVTSLAGSPFYESQRFVPHVNSLPSFLKECMELGSGWRVTILSGTSFNHNMKNATEPKFSDHSKTNKSSCQSQYP